MRIYKQFIKHSAKTIIKFDTKRKCYHLYELRNVFKFNRKKHYLQINIWADGKKANAEERLIKTHKLDGLLVFYKRNGTIDSASLYKNGIWIKEFSVKSKIFKALYKKSEANRVLSSKDSITC